MPSEDIDFNLICFASTPDFSDNALAYWEYIVNNTSMNTCWIISDETVYRLLKSRKISCFMKDTTEATEMVEKAKYLVSTHLEQLWFKKKEQVYISLWHGMPLKSMGFLEYDANHDPKILEALKISSYIIDIFPVTSRFMKLCIGSCFYIDPRKVHVIGLPRNDLLLSSPKYDVMKMMFNNSSSKSRFLLYAPTMRLAFRNEGEGFKANIFNFSDYDIDKIEDILNKHDAYLVVKFHPMDEALLNSNNLKLPQRTFVLNNKFLNEDLICLYHILNSFDALITDYSSIMFDFLLLDRPIIFTCSDIDKYARDRGFVLEDPTYLMPGPITDSCTEFINILDEALADKDFYRNERQAISKIVHNNVDKYSSKRLYNLMMDIGQDGSKDEGLNIAEQFFIEDTILSNYAPKAIEWKRWMKSLLTQVKEELKITKAELAKSNYELDQLHKSLLWKFYRHFFKHV